MKEKSHKILQVANRKTSVKLTVEFTKEIDNALDEVIKGLPKTEGIAITKENVVVAATENYLDILRRNENKKLKAKKADKAPPVIKQESLLDLESVGS
jgi:hypothetical protein